MVAFRNVPGGSTAVDGQHLEHQLPRRRLRTSGPRIVIFPRDPQISNATNPAVRGFVHGIRRDVIRGTNETTLCLSNPRTGSARAV